jgi:hypothetical protein
MEIVMIESSHKLSHDFPTWFHLLFDDKTAEVE